MRSISRSALPLPRTVRAALGFGVCALCLTSAPSVFAQDPPTPPAPPPDPTAAPGAATAAGMWDVRAAGATGDGTTDDTAAFAKALAEAGAAGGGVVHVPAGRYLLKGTLEIPSHVALEGVARAPATSARGGSVLLATAGAGEENGTPFLTLRGGATLRGITVFYPEQVAKNPPTPYPWCVRGAGDNCAIVDVLLVNPYQAVDFGTNSCGRHFIKGLNAQPLRRGLLIDNCFDVGRVENIHFWPFWIADVNGPVKEFTQTQGEAFLIGRTDWEYVEGCFTIWYAVGYRFFANPKHGPGNAVLTNCGADVGPVSVRVEATQGHAGVSFVNGQFMSGIEILPTNDGPVKFTSCGFWGVPEKSEKFIPGHKRLVTAAGRGTTMFTACHFVWWDALLDGTPAIEVDGGTVMVNGCDFLDGAGKKQAAITEKGGTLVVTASRLRGGAKLENRAGEKGKIVESGNIDR